MKYLHLFNTKTEYDARRNNNYEEPWTSLTLDTNTVNYNKTIDANGRQYVDLELPSGTMWATCNIGAINPEDFGDYYAWGEVETKPSYDTSNYKYWTDTSNITKYNSTDGLLSLELEDDVAHLQFGGGWRIPTQAQLWELLNNTNAELTTINSVYCAKLTSKLDNTKYIILPAAGKYNGTRSDNKDKAYIWSKDLYTSDKRYAMYIQFDKNGSVVYQQYRSIGFPIRPVILPT